MRYMVEVKSGSGHDDLDEEYGGPDVELFKFSTEAERAAFIEGVNAASNALGGWVDGWVEAKAL